MTAAASPSAFKAEEIQVENVEYHPETRQTDHITMN
jgi:hypothetical protein